MIDPEDNEKYHDPAVPCSVYGKSRTTTSSLVTPLRLIESMKLFMCSSASMPASRLNLGNHFSGWAGIGLKGAGIKIAPGLFHGDWSIVEILVEKSGGDDLCSWEDEDTMIVDD